MGLRTALGIKPRRTERELEPTQDHSSARQQPKSAPIEPAIEKPQSLRVPTTSSALKALRGRGVPIETVLDVGVQHGSPELCASCPDIPHMLFEPVTEFQASIASNYRNIPHEVVAAAVSDGDGETLLEVQSVVPGFPVSHSHIVGDGETPASSRRVPMISVDSFLAARPDIKAPFLLKIDIDGLELSVLSGAQRTLAQCSVVIIEMKMENFYERSAPLISRGFNLIEIVDLAYYRGIMRQVDAVFLHSDCMEHVEKKGAFDFSDWQSYKP